MVGQAEKRFLAGELFELLGREREIKTFQGINQRYKKQQLHAGFGPSLIAFDVLVVNGTLILLIWQGDSAISDNRLEQGMLVALINYLLQILVELVKLIIVVTTLNQTYISTQRISRGFEQKSEDVDNLPVL